MTFVFMSKSHCLETFTDVVCGSKFIDKTFKG